MTVSRRTVCFNEKFNRAQVFTTTPGQNGWTIADTSAAGAPTYLCVTGNGGAATLTLEATSEAQNVCLYLNDVLPYDLAQIQNVSFIADVASFGSASTLIFGLGSARNDTPDSVAVHAWFRMEGATSTSNVVVETDDGTNDNDDKATGETLAAVSKKFLIDFTLGISDVRFFIDGERVAPTVTFNMSNITADQNVQPIVQIQKTAATNASAVTIRDFEINYVEAYGA